MEDESEEYIRIKIAITLNRLLQTSKNSSNLKEKKIGFVKSYNQIAIRADVRKATVSNTFNAITTPNAVTLISIIEAMGYDLHDFARIYQSITNSDIKKFK